MQENGTQREAVGFQIISPNYLDILGYSSFLLFPNFNYFEEKKTLKRYCPFNGHIQKLTSVLKLRKIKLKSLLGNKWKNLV